MLTRGSDTIQGLEQTLQPASAQECGHPLDERREATRFRREEGTDFAVIWREPGEELLVEVHDESLSGLGIVVDSKLGLEVGSKLHVVYAGEYMDGEVRHIQPEEDRYRIGLQCRRMLRNGLGE
jgi:hypothetical protein